MSGRLGCDGRIVAASIVFNKEHVLKIKAIAPWFGGKRTMAPDIVKELGQHKRGASPKEAQEVLIINGTSFA